jgi:hypothetical protein
MLPGSIVTSPTDFPMLITVAHFPHHMKCYPVCLKDRFLDDLLSLISLKTWVFSQIFADDVKIYRELKFTHDSWLFQSEINDVSSDMK